MKSGLRAQREALKELWRRGLSGHELITWHTGLVDQFIVDLFNESPIIRPVREKVALVALGGYGRRELYPYSDIDLMVLHERKVTRSMQEVTEVLLYPLWDSDFDVGHSVRTVGDALRFARDDFVFRVSLLDSRFLAGSRKLYDTLLKKYRKKVINGQRNEFVRTMNNFRDARREQFGAHSYLLEPHIKEGKGGMRDIQAMLWTANVLFGLSTVADLKEAGMLRPAEVKRFSASWNHLIMIRNRLHYLSGRKNDQLFFEYQEEMAAAFGYRDEEGQLGVERFMRHVYAHLQVIAVITDLFFDHVNELQEQVKRGRRNRIVEERLEKSVLLRDGRIVVADREALRQRPQILMRLFFHSASRGKPLHHRTRKLISEHLDLIDDSFRRSRRVANSFQEILEHGRNVFSVLETMLETGVLPAYIPEFADIESLAQHDLYHIYTVDRHLLQAISELHDLREREGELFRSLAGPRLLFLATLLHDIGKGKRSDHSELGAAIIVRIGRRLGFGEEDLATLAFLVRYHLFLPEKAMRRDLEDEGFIRRSAGLIGDADRLTMLYLLTIADSRATGPSAWSSWKKSLLAEFYWKIKSVLEAAEDTRRLVVSEQEEIGVSWLRERVAALLDGEKPRIDLEMLTREYLLSFTPEAVAEHLRIHRHQNHLLRQEVLVFPEERQGCWSLLFMTGDSPGLLANLCGVLALHNLSVLTAQIFTWQDSTAVDVLDVAPLESRQYEEQDWEGLRRDINLAINGELDVGYLVHTKLKKSTRQRRHILKTERKVIVDRQGSERFTVIEIHGDDRPGALFQLAQTLTDLGLDIHRAIIATEVEQLIDIFYVTDRNGRKIQDAGFEKRIEDTLHFIIQPEENSGAKAGRSSGS